MPEKHAVHLAKPAVCAMKGPSSNLTVSAFTLFLWWFEMFDNEMYGTPQLTFVERHL